MNFFKKEVSAFSMVLQFGLNMIVPILGLTVFGAWLGEKIGVNWIAIPFFVLGALAGATNVYRLSKRFFKKEPKESTAEVTSEQSAVEVDDVKETK